MSYDWRRIIVSPTNTIQEVLAVIDIEALQLALVTDAENRLLGTVTDGDIRRALINSVPLSNPISEIMYTAPTVIDCSVSKVEILELMNTKQLNAIPIVDNGILVGLETIHNVTQKNKYDNPVFIMAGGFGTRLRPLTDNCPKPMLKVGGSPMLETLILQFKACGFRKFYISTHFLPHIIHNYFGDGEKLGVEIEYVHENEPLGTGGALGLLPSNMSKKPLVMINGDVLTTVDFLKVLQFHMTSNADATMCVREHEYQVPYGVVEGEGISIERMSEKPTYRFHVNTGIYIVDNSIVRSVQSNQKIDMPSLLEQHIANRKNIHKYPLHEYWLDIGRKEDFERAQIDIKRLGII
jgi:dTDP-glucose pyrophosphorylase